MRNHTNQFARTVFEITEEYWPYESRVSDPLPAAKETTYVQAVRKMFLSIAYTSSKFTNSDARVASQMQIDGVPLSVVQDAILLGACRKYIAWLNSSSAEPIVPIGSLRYFTPIVAELCRRPLPLSYREHLQIHNARYGPAGRLLRAATALPTGDIRIWLRPRSFNSGLFKGRFFYSPGLLAQKSNQHGQKKRRDDVEYLTQSGGGGQIKRSKWANSS